MSKEKTKKVSKEEVKESKVKKDVKKTTKKENKKEVKVKKESFFTGVRKEMKHVRWPLKKEMVKYSIATLSFIIFFALFFMLTNVIISVVKNLVA